MNSASDLIPVADPGAAYRRLAAGLDAAVARVLASGRYVLGPEGAAFEGEFSAWLGRLGAGPIVTIGVATGTDALWLALRSLDLTPGQGVLVAALVPSATVAAIVGAGLRPVFCDIDPATGTIDAADAARRTTAATRAVVAVHLYGNPCDLESLAQLGLPIIEDCAQAHGALWRGRPVGSLGQAAGWSFYPTKNLGALGDAGAITVADPAVAERLRRLRQYGWRERNISLEHGWSSRLDELQAAVLRVRLQALDGDNERRRAIAAYYRSRLPAGVQALSARAADRGAEHLFLVRYPDRDGLRARLHAAGVGTGIHYRVPAHLQPAYAHLGPGAGALPHTELVAREALTLPLYPELTDAEVDQVVAALRAATRPRPA